MSEITEATLFRLSKEKLLDAGYVFLRLDDADGLNRDPRIRYCKGTNLDYGRWKVMETFPSKAARNRRAKELIESGKYLID